VPVSCVAVLLFVSHIYIIKIFLYVVKLFIEFFLYIL